MADATMEMVVKLVDEATANLKKIKSQIGGLSDETKKTGKTFSSFSDTVKSGLIALGSGAVLGMYYKATAAVIEQAAAFEQSKIAFSTMLGSQEKGLALLQNLSDFAAKTPFTLQGVEGSAKMLLAMGIEADKIIPTLKSLGDVASGLSVPIDQLALAYGQVRAAGQLYGTELRQFVMAGVPIMGQLAKQFGVTESEIKDMVEKGKIGFKDVEKAFQSMSGEGGTFFNLMDAQSKTFSGQVSNMKDNLTKLAREIGGPLIEALKPALEAINNFMNTITNRIREVGFKQWVEENKTAIYALVGVLGGVFLAVVVGAIAAIVSLAGTAIAIGLAVAAVGAAIGALVAKWPEIKAAALAALSAVVGKVTEVKDSIVNKFLEIRDGIVNAVNAAGEWITNVWNSVVDGFTSAWATVVDAVTMAMDAVAMVITMVWDGIVLAVTTAVNAVASVISAVWGGILEAMKFLLAFAVGAIVLLFQAMGIDIVAVVMSIKDAVVNGFNTMVAGAIAVWTELSAQVIAIGQGIAAGVTMFLDALWQLWQFVWGEIVDFVTWAWEGITGAISEKATQASDIITSVLGMISALWTTVWGGITNFVKTQWESIKAAVSAGLTALWSMLSPALTTMKTAFTAMWEAFGNGAKAAWEGAKSIITSSINWIIEKINKLIGGINAIASKGAGVLGIKAAQIPTIPALAKGGTVTGSGTVMVGERGPEFLNLPRGASVTPLDKAGGGVTIQINNPTIMSDDDVVKFGDRLIQVLKQHAAIT